MSAPTDVLIQDLAFCYEGAQQSLFTDLTISFSRGYTGIIGANGAGKSTLLKLVAGELKPTAGSISGASNAIYCEQRTDLLPPALQEFFDDYSGDAHRLRVQLSIQHDFAIRWSTLSHGERKRAQIATALWQNPEILAIDEPTNHIDANARQMLMDALGTFTGVCLLVSHDRELLDNLCQRCLWLEPPGIAVYSGGYTEASLERDGERISAEHEQQKANRAYAQLQKEAVRRRDKASRANRDRSKRNISVKDHDAKSKIDLARVSGKDGQAGRQLRQLEGRLEQLKESAQATTIQKTFDTGVWLPGSASKRDFVLLANAGNIPVGDRRLSFPELRIQPTDRISVTGENGAGKSTLLDYLIQHLNIAPEKLVRIPQEVLLSESQALINQVRQLPKEQLGQVMTFVSRLGSRPGRLLDSYAPSPGEVRKLLLALGMLRAPHLIVMDEPTNHMDLPSIEALETALASCPCALLLVSHDEQFLHELTDTDWHIEFAGESQARLIVSAR